MAALADWQIDPVVAAGLEQLGWQADAPEVRDVVPVVLRGSNVVAVLPPAPAWATPLLAGLIGRRDLSGSLLILTAPAMLGEWALTVGAILEGTALQVAVAREPGKSAAIAADVLIASPESALERHARSALHPERFRALLFAWPEQWHADEAVAALLQDMPRDAQRVVLTTRRDQLDGTDGVIERYARKALVLPGAPGESSGEPARATSVRSVAATWGGRAATVAAVLGAIDQPQATVWTADQRDHQLIRRTLGSLRPGLGVASRTIPATGTVVCYDPPSPSQLARLSSAGEVILLVPPGCEQYVARIAPARRPMQPDSAAAAAVTRDAVLRSEIARTIDSAESGGALYAIAPLFEAHDPQAVAAALFALWRTAAAGTTATPAVVPHTAVLAPAPGHRDGPSAASGNSAVAKIWIGAGKKDDATVADFVAVLVREVGVERGRIGRIELRDTFAIVEVPAADAAAIVQRLSGITIRRRKLTARVDQGRGGETRAKRRP